eukprot:58113_1
MVSIHSPLQQQHRRRSVNHKMAPLSATAEFFQPPMPASPARSASSSSSDSSSSEDDDDEHEHEEYHEVCSMPPAHHQLLSGDQTSFTGLGGYDHTANSETASRRDNGGGDDGIDSAANSYCRRQKLSTVKRQGGGSWLLGFAGLTSGGGGGNDEPADDAPPDLVRDSFVDSEDESSSDEDSSADADGDSDDDDDSSSSAPTTTTEPRPKRRPGVSFSEAVAIHPVPHSSALSPLQRRKMYSSSIEVRQNKIRNKREYRYDGCDWKNSTEEWEMGVDMVTGELVHPAHENYLA